ncbi:biotin--[acetyl-CoA-carboxylase] ligase [Bacillus sp. HMF5848]|uniref:biotin--[acetyl-CoA-carboxylase] ligase n=1 Tax=Bacillus sp. HMF5848 TaxID=2495421 RepID=UPI00163A3E8C|nr:biotin--[acetyl-CoA-carboxylase] ligase [Bacillus sp. HMF5848]
MQTDIRKTLLRIFSDANGDFVSGERISRELGCSRTAVWKHMEDLRKEGFKLEGIRKLGYRIIDKPDKITANEITLGLQTDILGRHIHFEEEVDSTQKIAQRLALEGVPEGTIVVAEAQTAGRGRLNRHWHSPRKTGVWMSLILRPQIAPQKAPQLTLLTAVAVAQAIEEVIDVMPQIKWPNDILIKEKKAIGILTEMQAEADRIGSVIIGIGVNCNQEKGEFPEDITNIATSLAIEANKRIDRSLLIQSILHNFEKLYITYLEHGFTTIKILWESYAISLGKKIKVQSLAQVTEGTALGITDDGVLLIETADGQIHKVYSGDIHFQD